MPAQPDEYCQHRIQTAINFFKDRIPLRYRIRSLCQSIIVGGSLAGVLLATWGLMVWAAIISITTGAVTAWLEFTGTNNKINRYSTTVAGLQNVLIWWNTRPAIEKSSTANIDRLVNSVESLLRDEQMNWRSTSQAEKLLAKQSKEGMNGNNKEDV
jgi:hypothetical protein